MDDQRLLERFTRDGSQDAFRELTERYTNLVHGCAVQRLHDAHAAQDVTQAVFLALALKAKGLRPDTPLPGWLFKATRFACAMHQRGEQRRKEREMRAFEESQIADAGTTTEVAWEELEPHLAGALDSLSGTDREAVLLRFYRKASHQEVAAALGTSEDGARMRVDRALDKLRRFFTKKGVALSATALVGALTANAAQAAPVGLAATAGATALAGVSGTLATTSTLILAKGAIQMMLTAQVKTAAFVAAACIVVAGGGAIVVTEIVAPPAPKPSHAAFINTDGEVGNPIADVDRGSYADRLRDGQQRSIEASPTPAVTPPPPGPATFANTDGEAKTPISNADHSTYEDRLRERRRIRQSMIESQRTGAVAPPPPGYHRISYDSCPLDMAVKRYGELTGRSVLLSPSSGNRLVTIHTGLLTLEEAIRVYEIAFDLLGLRIEKDAEQAVRIFPKEPAIHVRLVAAEKPKWQIWDMEMPTREPLEEATCLARGASVDGTNTFDRYEQDKYFTRTSNLTLDPAKLGAGEHAIEPGHHVFLVEEDGTLSSTDPDIIVDGQTVSLKTHRIEILQRHPDMSGPLGLYLPPPGFDAAKDTFDAARAMNLLSHSRKLTALRIYLPANTNGNGYLLTPSMQAFHVRPGGTVEFHGTPAPGLKAEGRRILLP